MAGDKDNLHLQDLLHLEVGELSLVDDNAIETPFAVIKRRDGMKTRVNKAKPGATEEQSTAEKDPVEGEGVGDEQDPMRAFSESVERETSVSKALELHDLDIDTYRSNICEAVRKSNQFGKTRDSWDIFVQTVTEKSVVVRNYHDNDMSLTIGDFSTEDGVNFTFANVGKAMQRWERVPEAGKVAKSLGGELDDRDAALNELIDAEALDVLTKALNVKPAGLPADADEAAVIAAKAKVFTRTRTDKLKDIHSKLGELLAQVEPAEESETIEAPAAKATTPPAAPPPAGAAPPPAGEAPAAQTIDVAALTKSLEGIVSKAIKPMRADLERLGDRLAQTEESLGTIKSDVATAKAKAEAAAKTNAAPKGGAPDKDPPATTPVRKNKDGGGWDSVLR